MRTIVRQLFVPIAALLVCANANGSQVREPVELVNLSDLCIAFFVLEKDRARAGLRDHEGILYNVEPGSYVGRNNGRIESITEEAILLIEIVEAGGGGWKEREATIVRCEPGKLSSE